MEESSRGENRLYWALALTTLPVVIIAATSVALGGRSTIPGAPYGGLPLPVVIELAVLGPVFVVGVILALRAVFRDVAHRP